MTDPVVKNFVTDFGAVGDGTTDDSPAVDRWLAWAKTQGTTPVELYMPPLDYHFAGTNALTNGLFNATISGYGATVDNLFIGVIGAIVEDQNHSARLQTTDAGATSTTLVNAGDVSKFSVGQWVLIAGLGLQNGGYPPNYEYNEYRQITGISGSTISWSDPLKFTYESTWPQLDPNKTSTVDLGGPATMYALSPSWDSTHTYLGLTVDSTTFNGAVFTGGRNVTLDGMSFTGLGPAPSVSQHFIIQNTQIGSQNEVDKAVEYLQYDHDTGTGLAQILVQSASVTDLVISNSTLTTLNGTAQNTTIDNSSFNQVYLGPLYFGHGDTITITNSTIANATIANSNAIDPSTLTFANGVFSIPNTSASHVWQWAVPHEEYFFAYYDGSIHNVDDSGHVTSFKILDEWQDATYTYVSTDLGSVLPTPTFLGGVRSANAYMAYPAMTITEINSGPADASIWSPDLTVPPVNDALVAVDDSYITNENMTLTVAGAGVLANDINVDSAALTVSLVSGPAHGTVTLNADGTFSYTPAANYNGADSFTYKDGQPDSNVATVSLTVTPVNNAPVANDDFASVAKGRAITADAQHGVLVNDGDLDSDGLSVSAVNGSGANVGQTVVGTYGSLTLNTDGSYSYVANKGHLPPMAQDSFTYTASDGHGGTSTATLTVTITKPGAVTINMSADANFLVTGSGGADKLTGGRGHDTYVYTATADSTPSAPDTITNFNVASDKIDFSAISGLNSNIQPVTVNFLNSTPTSIAPHTIDVVTSGGNTVVYADATGKSETISNGHEDMQINLTGVTSPTLSDFILHH